MVIIIYFVYYKFILVIFRISFKGLLNFNWNEEVKIFFSFIKDKVMYFGGLGIFINLCYYISSFILK